MTNANIAQKRVAVIAEMRSGGTMLMTALDSHPMIRAYRGEPCRPDSGIMRNGRPDLTLKQAYKIAMYQPHAEVAAVKMTYGQLWDVTLDVVDSIATHYIHVTRRDVIAQVTSVVVANQRKRWHSIHSEPPPVTPFTVNISQFIDEVERIYRDREAWGAMLRETGKAYMALPYEEFSRTRHPLRPTDMIPAGIEDILLNFLDVDPSPLTTVTRKMTRQYPSEIITNWPELLTRLKELELTNAATLGYPAPGDPS